MTILIDPGHGGSDPGATANKLVEKDLNLEVAGYIAHHLIMSGYQETMLTRDGDHRKSLSERVWLSDTLNPDLFLSIHHNSFYHPDASGTEVFTSLGHTDADVFATEIFRQIKNDFPGRHINNSKEKSGAKYGTWHMRADYSDGDPDKEAPFYVLRKTKCPAVLVEVGFVSSPEDALLLKDKEFKVAMATSIAKAVVKTLESKQNA